MVWLIRVSRALLGSDLGAPLFFVTTPYRDRFRGWRRSGTVRPMPYVMVLQGREIAYAASSLRNTLSPPPIARGKIAPGPPARIILKDGRITPNVMLRVISSVSL